MSAPQHRRPGRHSRRRADLPAAPMPEKSPPGAPDGFTVPDEWVTTAKTAKAAAGPEGANPYEDIPVEEALASLDEESWPPVANLTGNPLDPSADVLYFAGPMIIDGIPAPDAPAAAAEPVPPGYRVQMESRALLYTESGWTDALTASRLRSGEWDNVYTLSDAAMSRAVKRLRAASWNARDTIGEGWRNCCLELGRPDLIVPGWKMIRDLAALGARERNPRPTFTPAAPETRPQPALHARSAA